MRILLPAASPPVRLDSDCGGAYYRLERRSGLSQGLPVLDLAPMQNLVLHGGFLIAEIRLTSQFLAEFGFQD
jgi:hypothetical protein